MREAKRTADVPRSDTRHSLRSLSPDTVKTLIASLGLAFFYSYDYSFAAGLIQPSSSNMFSTTFLIYMAVKICLCILVFSLAKKYSMVVLARWVPIAFGLMALVACPVLLTTSLPALIAANALVAMVDVGLLLMWLAVIWKSFLVTAIYASIPAVFLVNALVLALPASVTPALASALPLLSAASLIATVRIDAGNPSDPEAISTCQMSSSKVGFVRTMAFCLAMSVPLAFSHVLTRGNGWEYSGTGVFLPSAVISSAIVLLMRWRFGDCGTRRFILTTSCATLVLGSLVIPLFDVDSSLSIPGILIYVGDFFCKSAIYCEVIAMASGEHDLVQKASLALAVLLAGHVVGRTLGLAYATSAYGLAIVDGICAMLFLAGLVVVPKMSEPQPHPDTSSPAPTSSRDIEFQLIERYDLSSREADVLSLVRKGMNARLIAERLGISTNTAKSHLDRLYKKLGVHSREGLIRLCDTFEEHTQNHR